MIPTSSVRRSASPPNGTQARSVRGWAPWHRDPYTPPTSLFAYAPRPTPGSSPSRGGGPDGGTGLMSWRGPPQPGLTWCGPSPPASGYRAPAITVTAKCEDGDVPNVKTSLCPRWVSNPRRRLRRPSIYRHEALVKPPASRGMPVALPIRRQLYPASRTAATARAKRACAWPASLALSAT